MSTRCWCGAGYGDAGDCPRCSADRGLLGMAIAERVTTLPDGPDDLLCHIAELEAQVAAERRVLEETGGARTCRYCRGLIPPGDDPGTHDECLPAELPEGARSCAGCAELILDADDEFEHDFCPTPADEAPTEPRLTETVFESVFEADPFVSDLFDGARVDLDHTLTMSAQETPPGKHGPRPEPPDVSHRYEDAVRCPCGHWVKVVLVAPPLARARHMVSAERFQCECGTDITVAYSWRNARFVGLKIGDQTVMLS